MHVYYGWMCWGLGVEIYLKKMYFKIIYHPVF